MKKIILTLDGFIAETIVYDLARRYAMATIHGRLTNRIMVNAPWFRGGKPNTPTVHFKWMTGVDQRRAGYKSALQSIVEELPDVPTIDYRPVTDKFMWQGLSPRQRKDLKAYSAFEVDKVAKEYAEKIISLLL